MGWEGLAKNPQVAVALWQISADQGDPVGQCCLGNAHYCGWGGLKKDRANGGAAQQLLELSAHQGNKTAAALLDEHFGGASGNHLDVIMEDEAQEHAQEQEQEHAQEQTQKQAENHAHAHAQEHNATAERDPAAMSAPHSGKHRTEGGANVLHTSANQHGAAAGVHAKGLAAVALPSALDRLSFTPEEQKVLTCTPIPAAAAAQPGDVHSNVGKVLVVGVHHDDVAVTPAAAGGKTAMAETATGGQRTEPASNAAVPMRRTIFATRCVELVRSLGPVKLSKVPAAYRTKYGEALDHKALGYRKLATALKSVEALVVAGELSNVTVALASDGQTTPPPPSNHSGAAATTVADGGGAAQATTGPAATARPPLVQSPAATSAVAAAATGGALVGAIPEWQLCTRAAQAQFVVASRNPPQQPRICPRTLVGVLRLTRYPFSL